MRKAALLFVIAVCAYAAKAQLTLRPQIGFESPLTKISYNHSPFNKALCQFLPQAGVRADYQFKKGLAPYLGVFTHRPLVNYSFSDPKSGMTSYHATTGDLQLQLQAGLQYSIKPFTLSKKTVASKTNTEKVSEAKSNCYHSCQSSCRKRSSEAQMPKQPANLWTLRLQPSAGIGYVPSGKEDIEMRNSASYLYNAGNIKTELITALGFELARNRKKIITLSINYFKGLGTNETSFTTEEPGSKPLTTNLRSRLSGWNASIGIPISFAKKSTATKTQKNNHRSCTDYYKKRCSYRVS